MQDRNAAGILLPNFYNRLTDGKDKKAHISFNTYMALPPDQKALYGVTTGPSLVEKRALGMAGNGVPRKLVSDGP